MLLHRTGAIFEIICIFEKQTLKYEADILVHFYVGNACRQRAFPVWTTERIGSWTITDGALRDIRHRLREKVCDLGGLRIPCVSGTLTTTGSFVTSKKTSE